MNKKNIRSGIKSKGNRLCCIALAFMFAFTACGSLGSSSKDAAKDSGDLYADSAAQEDMISGLNGDYGSIFADEGIRIPVSRTCIYVNRAGYVSGREKKVLFLGEQHGETFDVVRSSDGTVAYTAGIPDGMEDTLSGRFFCVADFTDFNEPGTYYIRTDIIGQSYPFTIAEDTYENLFLNMLRTVPDVSMKESPEGVCDVSFGMHAVMHALHCNGALFEAAYQQLDEDEQDKQLVVQILYMARWLISQQGYDGSIYGDYEATAAFCGIIMMSRASFGKYEASVDSEYRQAAEKAWRWLEKQECDTDVRKEARFYAAAQFFRSDGSAEYKTIAEEFLREKNEDYVSERFVFYGVLAYISAEMGTDRDLCTYIMKDIVSRTKDLCEQAKADAFLGIGVRTAESNMSNMLLLSFANYLMPSKEYTVIIENTIHYMGGLNENGICYIGADGTWMNLQESSQRNFEWNGVVLLAMSDMLQNLNEIE